MDEVPFPRPLHDMAGTSSLLRRRLAWERRPRNRLLKPLPSKASSCFRSLAWTPDLYRQAQSCKRSLRRSAGGVEWQARAEFLNSELTSIRSVLGWLRPPPTDIRPKSHFSIHTSVYPPPKTWTGRYPCPGPHDRDVSSNQRRLKRRAETWLCKHVRRFESR